MQLVMDAHSYVHLHESSNFGDISPFMAMQLLIHVIDAVLVPEVMGLTDIVLTEV